ncbi:MULTISPECIES: LamG-like jellyroll fold domain-containing protein [Methylomicrobium]|uniref:PDK repeat-containing protein n=1 Tax=Methylomicrobium album BG8 TaxID=686340 RepID=H8GM02_METAL|nr:MULTISPECIES: LamG-like jellyroll fold domain-containing protein [Methylomicrobium]EIC28198.1 PDK repeat-containing protein [Methylomicrobium album BG8]
MKNFLITNTALRKLFPRNFLTLLSLLLFGVNSYAGTINLAWDASTSSNIGGYKVSYGTSSNKYTTTVDAGSKTTYSVSGLQDGTQYFFAVKAYDTAKTSESAYSNEINTTAPAATPALTADFTASKTSGMAPLTVDFTPATTGTVTSWKWDFPSSYTPTVTNSSAKVTTVTYATPGTYNVSLTVTGANGSATKTKPGFITVSGGTAPVANFSATPTSGGAPLTVNFTDTSSGNITGRSWNFGDGSTSTATSPNHIYSAPGTYTVSLTVTGTGGSNTKTNSNFINVSSSTGGTTQSPANSNDGLVAAYGFEEDSGTTVADASGKGNHGTIKEAVRIANGRYGKALKFDGINDWVTVNDSASLDLSTGLTLEAWVYPLSQSNGGNTIILKQASGAEVYALYSEEDDNLPVSYINDGSYRSVVGPNRLPTNTWTHLVATYDQTYQRLYVNGAEVAKSTRNTLIQPSDGVLRIGGNSLWGEYFHGYIDEVRIYNRALTASEVSTNMKTAVSVSNPSQLVMGDKNVEPWAEARARGTAEAFQTVPSASKTITSVQIYLDAGSTATKVAAGIYSDNYGHPGTRIGQGKIGNLKAGAWNTVPVSAAAVTQGKPYWIAILSSQGQIVFRDQVGSSTGKLETSASTALTDLPNTWRGAAAKGQAALSIYGNGY